jgi:hypothetical protein
MKDPYNFPYGHAFEKLGKSFPLKNIHYDDKKIH